MPILAAGSSDRLYHGSLSRPQVGGYERPSSKAFIIKRLDIFPKGSSAVPDEAISDTPTLSSDPREYRGVEVPANIPSASSLPPRRASCHRGRQSCEDCPSSSLPTTKRRRTLRPYAGCNRSCP